MMHTPNKVRNNCPYKS